MVIKENLPIAITNGGQVVRILRNILDTESQIDQDKEHFWSFGLDVKNRVKYVELVSLGTLNNSIVHSRETFRLAILKGVSSIIVAHNHPSGDPTPSKDDIAVTEKLRKSGEIIGIKLLDHIIIGKENFVSMLDSGLMQ